MRPVVAFVALAASCFAATPARADEPNKRARAASEYDAGASAFKKKDFEGAAAHFEAADAALPSAGALRQAMRARSEAGQGSRAATLAALALERYPNDGPLFKIAHDTIEKYELVLHKLHVTCASPCTVAVGGLAVPGEPRARWDVYLDPGSGTVTATFGDGAKVEKQVEAKPGGEGDLRLEPKKAAPPPVAPVAGPVGGPVPDAGSRSEVPPDDGKADDKDKDGDKPDDQPRKGISPVFFGVGAAAFVGLGAATIWSGIDTENNPGQAAVRAACQGKGTSCPEYQLGLAHQTRTNVLVGVTAATGVATIVLGIFTNWKGNKKPPAAEPTAIVLDRGGALGARGVF